MRFQYLPVFLWFFPLVLIFGARTSFAEVRLQLDECIDVKLVNGQSIDDFSGRQLVLEDGIHQLVVDCTLELGRSSDDSALEKTEAFVIRFEAADADLSLSTPTIKTIRELEDFNREGNFQLLTSSAQPLDFHSAVLKKEGYKIFRDYSDELAVFNRSNSAAAIHEFGRYDVPALSSEEAAYSSSTEESVDQQTVSRMLRFWYLRADKRTRNDLEAWIRSRN